MEGSLQSDDVLEPDKDFDAWNVKKKVVHTSEFRGFVRVREIWWCSLGVNVGDEEDGKNELFERPVLVLKRFNQRIVLSVPLTTHVKDNEFHFAFEYEGERFAVILSQLRLISTKRLTRRIRRLDSELFAAIKQKIKKVAL
jgi:mRNA interferase MazF